MTQTGSILSGAAIVNVDLPAAEITVLPGLRWGAIDAFPTPAYWTYQVFARRVNGTAPRHRLGSTLKEEVAACLLGGHGIPAKVGIFAFHALRSSGALSGSASEAELLEQLSGPLDIQGRQVRYRFARQKAKYLSLALARLDIEKPPTFSGRALRDWLTQMPGIGYKTASWVARNWLEADDVAILDIHILRAGILGKFFSVEFSVERNYLELEAQFLSFAKAIGVKSSELDAVIWHEMMSSPRSVARLMGENRTGGRVSTIETERAVLAL